MRVVRALQCALRGCGLELSISSAPFVLNVKDRPSAASARPSARPFRSARVLRRWRHSPVAPRALSHFLLRRPPKKKRSSSLKKYNERESERERGIERDTRGIAKYFAILHRLSPTFVSYITITLSTERFYIILKRSRLRLVIPKQSVIFVSTRYLSI